MIGELLRPEFEEMIARKQWVELASAVDELDPPDVAELIEDLPPECDGMIFRALPRNRAAEVFSYLALEHQEELIQTLSNDQTNDILSAMKPDDRAKMLHELPAEVTRRLILTLSPEELKKTRELLGYAPKTAGRFMTPDYATIDPDSTAAEAIEHIRRTGRGKETLAIVYMVDRAGRLVEDVRLGSLVMASPNTLVREIDERPLISIKATQAIDEVVQIFEKYDRVALPVIDEDGMMLGIVTADDVLEVAQRQATKEIQQLGGSEALDAPYFDVGFWSMVRKRGGWLAVLFLGEMLTATAMGYFENEIEKAAVVALFVPLIISSGGNSGSQGTSLLIRSLALGEVKLKDWWRVLGRELRTGLALGIFLGVIGLLRIGAWQGLSHVPHVGTFFRTQAGQLPEGAIEGSSSIEKDVTLKTATLFPAGTVISKGTAIPPEANMSGELAGVYPASTAYGKYWFRIGLTVMFALIGIITWGSVAGSMLPFILRALGFDPATSSAPFVATLVDVTGLIIYFTTAEIILRGTLL